jgi:hypothetical protein
MSVSRRMSVGAYVGMLLCFFLPFATVSCQGQTVASMTGLQLAIGMQSQQEMSAGPKASSAQPNPFARLALVGVVVGLVLSLRGRGYRSVRAAIGLTAAVALLLLKASVESEVHRQSIGMLSVEFGPAYWIAVLLGVAASAAALAGPSEAETRIPHVPVHAQ